MCEHKDFRAQVNVNRLEDTKGFMADITINCSECNIPFQFIGLPYGLNLCGAAMSPSGEEARIAIKPSDGTIMNLPKVVGFRIRKVH